MGYYKIAVTTAYQLIRIREQYPDYAFSGWVDLSINLARGWAFVRCSEAEAGLMVLELGVKVCHDEIYNVSINID